MSKSKFEDNLKELELIVKKLETGEMSLDKAIEDFEKSVELYKNCKSYLETAEKKIFLLNDELKKSEVKDE